MATHYHVVAAADFGSFAPNHQPPSGRFIHPDMDPCARGARFLLADEDGTPLLDIELETAE